MLGSGCEDDGFCGVLALGRYDGEALALPSQAGDLRELGLGAHIEGLGEHPVRELRAGDLRDAGEVVHLGRPGDLTAESIFLQHEHGALRAPAVDGRGKPRRPAADDDDVVRCKHIDLS